MPLYTSPASGAEIVPGDQFQLFDGTETPAAAMKSAAVNVGLGYGARPLRLAFTVAFPSAPTASVDIYAANQNIDSAYQKLTTTAISTQNGGYVDTSGYAWYRAVLSAYTSGGMPVVSVQA